MTESRPLLSSRLVFGLLILALGIAWMLDNLGFVDAGSLVRWWPVVPLVWGLALLSGTMCRRSTGWGLFWAAVGAVGLLGAFDLIRISVFDLWPVLLILAGVYMLYVRLSDSREPADHPEESHGQ